MAGNISTDTPNLAENSTQNITAIINPNDQQSESNSAVSETKEQDEIISIKTLQMELQLTTQERDSYKNKVTVLQSEISELKNQQPNILSSAQTNQVEKMKQMSEEMLTKAKGVIFDKIKICKNQELQIEALKAQIDSLKEVLSITKSLLEIRNIEVTHLEEKMKTMETKINIERQRHDLMHQKLDAMTTMNADLKSEYEIQTRIFHALRDEYQKQQSLIEPKEKE